MTPLWSSPSSGFDIVEQLAEGSPLKVSSSQGQRFLVYFEGSGHDQPATEGWVDRTDVTPTGAPKWVVTRWETDLGSGQSGQKVDRLSGGAVLQVLEDRGTELRGFYLGDGQSQDAVEGWIKTLDLGAAATMLRADSRGMKLLSQPEVAALGAGAGIWLKVPFRSQLDGSPAAEANCGPASVGMALDHFGGHFSTDELRDAANHLQGTWGPDSGFGIQYLAGLAQQFGLKAQDLNAGNGLKRWNVDDVKSQIAQGHLVIPELRFRLMPGRANSGSWDDHYVVITGMLGDDFIYNDSVDSDAPGYGRVMSAEDLTRAWGGSNFPFAAFALAKPQ